MASPRRLPPRPAPIDAGRRHPDQLGEAGAEGAQRRVPISPKDAHRCWTGTIRTSENSATTKFRECPFRNCLEIPNGLHSGLLRVGKTGRKAPFSPLCATKNTRSRPLQLFSKQFLRWTLAIRLHSKPHRLIVPQMPVGLLPSRPAGPTRKKSPVPITLCAPALEHR